MPRGRGGEAHLRSKIWRRSSRSTASTSWVLACPAAGPPLAPKERRRARQTISDKQWLLINANAAHATVHSMACEQCTCCGGSVDGGLSGITRICVWSFLDQHATQWNTWAICRMLAVGAVCVRTESLVRQLQGTAGSWAGGQGHLGTLRRIRPPGGRRTSSSRTRAPRPRTAGLPAGMSEQRPTNSHRVTNRMQKRLLTFIMAVNSRA